MAGCRMNHDANAKITNKSSQVRVLGTSLFAKEVSTKRT